MIQLAQLLRYLVRFDGLDAAEAGLAAEGLRRTLHDIDPNIRACRIRIDRDALDVGTVLEVLLAAPATVVLAKGISNWLGRTHSSKVTVVGPKGEVIVEGITAAQAADLAEKLHESAMIG